MLRLYAPAGVAVLAIVSLTVCAWAYSDRLGGGTVTAEDFGKRFANVPMTVGQWVGTDMTPESATLEQAGAVQYVSRRYVNNETSPPQSVDLWLIVGHSRDICRHTPDICYPSQGFSQIGSRVKWDFETADESADPPTFFTAKFRNESEAGNRDVRVFWAWTTDAEGKDNWDAPDPKTWFDWLPFKSTGPKVYYGNTPELYKMYFTAQMGEADEDVSDNIVNEFAELMLPQIDRALFPKYSAGEAKAKDAAKDSTDAAAAAAAK